MPAGTFTLFSANKDDLRLQDLPGATVKLMLTTSAYVPNVTTAGHSVLADVTNEIANGAGYTTGGYTLVTGTVTASGNGFKFSSADPFWNAAGTIPAWRNAVMYVAGTLWGKTSPLIGYFLADNTPGDAPATTTGNPLTITCPAGGWFDIV